MHDEPDELLHILDIHCKTVDVCADLKKMTLYGGMFGNTVFAP